MPTSGGTWLLYEIILEISGLLPDFLESPRGKVGI